MLVSRAAAVAHASKEKLTTTTTTTHKNPNAKDNDYVSALEIAVDRLFHEMVNLLVKSGGNMNITTPLKMPLLHSAVVCGDYNKLGISPHRTLHSPHTLTLVPCRVSAGPWVEPELQG